jgi:hypothetical protein
MVFTSEKQCPYPIGCTPAEEVAPSVVDQEIIKSEFFGAVPLFRSQSHVSAAIG